VRGEMRLRGSQRGFPRRVAVEIVCKSPACDPCFDFRGQGLDSPHRVKAEVGTVIVSVTSSGSPWPTDLNHFLM
jgi:hypothetical protein